MEAAGAGLLGGHEGGAVVGADLGVAEAADPGAHHVVGRRVQLHAARGRVHGRHVARDDEQHGLRGGLDAELRLRPDHGRPQVHEAAGPLGRDPLGPVHRHQREDELLELLGREGRQADAHRRHQHPLAVAVGPEEPQLAVVPAVHLEPFEALRRVVQHGRRRHQVQGSVGLQLRRLPSVFRRPFGRDHVVGAYAVAVVRGDAHRGRLPRGLCEVVDELGSVELLDVGLRDAIARRAGRAAVAVGVLVLGHSMLDS